MLTPYHHPLDVLEKYDALLRGGDAAALVVVKDKAKQTAARRNPALDAGFDADQAMIDVREKVDLVKPELPADTDEPKVNEVNVSLFPVVIVTLSGDVPERSLLKLARDLQDELEGLPGVLSADIAGDREEVLEVLIDPTRLETYDLSYEQLLSAVARNNQLVAAGKPAIPKWAKVCSA